MFLILFTGAVYLDRLILGEIAGEHVCCHWEQDFALSSGVIGVEGSVMVCGEARCKRLLKLLLKLLRGLDTCSLSCGN